MSTPDPRVAVDAVVPTVGRPSLAALLSALADGHGPRLTTLTLVDDRPRPAGALPGVERAAEAAERVEVVRGGGRGPAASRNAGWRRGRSPWVVFLDDDVVPEPAWRAALARDLRDAPADVAGVQGVLRVPLPSHRRPTDWERNVAGLEGARWATADMAYRREALEAAGGLDERFTRAYREDADLALRVAGAGRRLRRGARRVSHPVGPASAGASLRAQRGNADDVLMRALHGRGWRERAGAPAGRRPRHLAVTAAGASALLGAAAGRRGPAALAGLGWLAGTAELAWARIAPGPRTPREILTMAATSAAIPPLAAWHTARGLARLPALRPWRSRPGRARPDAVLLDRDGTLVRDVPYNGDPARVVPAPGAARALRALRRAGIPTAVVSNQSGIGRGLLTREQVDAVNGRIERLLGPLGPWLVCPHAPGEGCDCRKPRPGLVVAAARALGVAPGRCAVIGDIGADVEAARAAGARGILVPTAATRPDEVAAAEEVASDLPRAVERLLGGR